MYKYSITSKMLSLKINEVQNHYQQNVLSIWFCNKMFPVSDTINDIIRLFILIHQHKSSISLL